MVINMTMNRRLQIAGGEMLQATIWGDSEMSGEDWTGADCDYKAWACQIIHVITSGRGTLTARLNWSNPSNELGGGLQPISDASQPFDLTTAFVPR